MKNTHYIIKTPVGYVYGFDGEHQTVTYCYNVSNAKQFETYERAQNWQNLHDSCGYGFQKSSSLIFTVEKK